jgi:hypothetical protein
MQALLFSLWEGTAFRRFVKTESGNGIIADGRYGGGRATCPGCFLRFSIAKTAHRSGQRQAADPDLPPTAPHLLGCLEKAELGTDLVITGYRDGDVNLRKRPVSIITKAGLKPWPKLFVNLRSSRQTELVERWAIHVVCAWLGNSALIARKHYLQVTEKHFEEAAGEAAQKAAQQNADSTGNERHQVLVMAQEAEDSSENAALAGVAGNDQYTRQDSNL